jgi:hypothetical protein
MKPSHLLSPAVLLGMLSFSSCMDLDLSGMFGPGYVAPMTQVTGPEFPWISIDSITSHGDSATVWMRLDGDSTLVLHDIGLSEDAGSLGPKPVNAMELVNDTLELSPIQPYNHSVIIRELDMNTTYTICPKARYIEFADTMSIVGSCLYFRLNP